MSPEIEPFSPNGPFLIYVVSVMLFWVIHPLAAADELKLMSAIGMKQEYIDNLFGTEDTGDKRDDAITRIIPSFELSNRTERFETQMKGRAELNHYHHTEAFNGTNVALDAMAGVSLTEKIATRASVGYKKDDTPDRDIETTGIVQGTDQREHIVSTLSFGLSPSESASLNLNCDYAREDWEQKEPGDDDPDTISQGVDLRFLHHGPEDVWYGDVHVSAGARQYEFVNSKTETFYFAVGATYDLTETLSLDTEIGTRFSENSYSSALFQHESGDWGGLWSVALRRVFEKSQFTLSLSQDIKEASGLYRTTLRTSVLGEFRYHFSETSFIRTGARYFTNTADRVIDQFPEIDENTFSTTASLYYGVTRRIFMELSWDHALLRNEEADSRVTRNRYYVQVNYRRDMVH